MEEQTQELLLALYQTLGEAKDFVLSQAPEILRQMIIWQWVSTGILLLWVIVFSYLGVWLQRKAYKRLAWEKEQGKKADDLNLSDGLMALTIVAYGAATTVTAVAIREVYDSVQALVAPKLYLLEQLMELME